MQRDDDFRAYVDRSWPRLVRTARLLGSGAADAEDVAQSALLKVYLAWDQVSRASNIDGYVYRILVNTRITAARRRSAHEIPTAELDRATTPDPAPEIVLADLLVGALRTLPQKQRAVVVLRYYADLSVPQIAEVLGVPTGTLKSRLHRAEMTLQNDSALLEAFESEAR